MRLKSEEYDALIKKYPHLAPKTEMKSSAFLKNPSPVIASNGLRRAIKTGQMVKLKNRFEWQWTFNGGVELDQEFRFHDVRKFRFDYAMPDRKIAIELEGGIWRKQGGAHSGGVAANRDCEKYNLAALNGWTIFRLTTDMITADHIRPIINFCREGKK